MKLKSGTDVRGVAVPGVSGDVTLTDGAVTAIVSSFIAFMSEKTGKKTLRIALAHDSRVSSPRIYAAAARAITGSGCTCLAASLASTPSQFMILKSGKYSCDASVMITASHLPYERNGLKFFTPEGGLDSDGIDAVLRGADSGLSISGSGKTEEVSFMGEYSEGLVDMVRLSAGKDTPLEGKRIVVDAGCGVGGFYCRDVLEKLGADTTGSINLEPTGIFTAHAPNPEDRKAINCLRDAVLENSADFGIIFDTDVDRAACVDRRGEEINRNRLIALISALLLREKKGVIVTDSVASDHLAEFIESRGGKLLRYRRGYKNVIDKCRELNGEGVYSPLAIETSGHAAFKDNYYLDDGAYLITRLLIPLCGGEDLESLIKDLKEPMEETEIRLSFTEKSINFREEGARAIEGIREAAKGTEGVICADDDAEGVRLRFGKGHGDGWAQVRMSVHDPVMPINMESDAEGGTAVMAKTLHSVLSRYDFIDAGGLLTLVK